MMVNDLKPVLLEARRGDGQRAPVVAKAGSYPGATLLPKGELTLYFQDAGVLTYCAAGPISVEKTKQLIDQCITTYLLARLKHDDGDASGSVPQSPILETNEILDNDDPALQQKLTTLSIHLPRRPVGQVEEQNRPRRKPPHDFNHANSVPYSTSSPGSFFASHMEKRDCSRPRSRSRDPRGGEETSRVGHFDNHPNGEDNEDFEERKRTDTVKNLFKPLQEYLILCFGSFECVNSSFSTVRPTMASRAASEGGTRRPVHPHHHERRAQTGETMSELDAKTLLLGDFAENGSWWTGGREEFNSPGRTRMHRHTSSYHEELVTVKSPRLDWVEINEWYYLVLNAGRLWRRKLEELMSSDVQIPRLSDQEFEEIEDQITEAQSHAQRVLLKAIESLLKRPGRPLKEPSDLRFLLIILANPLLYPSPGTPRSKERSRSRSRERKASRGFLAGLTGSKAPPSPSSSNTNRGSSGQHSGIIKRILGLLSYTPNECHHYLISWFARYSDGQFQRTTDLIGSFVTYRLTRQQGKRREVKNDPTAGLVPSMSGRSTSAALHAALGVTGQTPKRSDGKAQPVIYNDDWQIKAAARVMQLLFTANNSGLARRGETRPSPALESGHSAGLAARERAHIHGQILPTSDFYNTLLDYSDLVADFEAWEGKRGKFVFCQYPFFLSIWAKIQIMEHDARRQMEIQAREAWFNSIMTAKTLPQYLVLRIRRDCLVEDSLKGVSEVVGAGGEEIKKGLRIEFKGEEGIDAGGLRKEWFLLLVRDVFNPEHGKSCT
jgi:E3 ubiquitin-protein ligase HECTD2